MSRHHGLSSDKEVVEARVHLIAQPSDEKELFDPSVHITSIAPSLDDRSGRPPSADDKQVLDTSKQLRETLWTPLFLRRPTTFAFVACALIILAVAEVLNARSNKDNGLVWAKPNLHYLWTFGPTAVLTILAALWNQVDYQVRRNAPFVKMSQAKLLAHESVLLDYLSPWDPQALVTGINRKDWQVSLSVLASLSLRLLIVLSTGLFALRYPSVRGSTALLQADRFDFARTARNPSDPGKLTSDGLSPAIFNVTYNDGTDSHYAAQSFRLAAGTIGTNATLTANVDVVSADLICEQADWTYTNRSFQYVGTLNDAPVDVDIWTDTYALSEYRMKLTTPASIPFDDWDMSKVPIVSSNAGPGWLTDHAFVNATCENKKSNSNQPCYLIALVLSDFYNETVPSNLGGGQGFKQTSTVTEQLTRDPNLPQATNSVLIGRQVFQTPDSGGQWFTGDNVYIRQMTAFLCQPKVTYARAEVSTAAGQSSTTGGINITRILEEIPTTSVGLSAWEYAEKVRTAALSDGLLTTSFRLTNFFALMDLVARRGSYQDYMDPAILSNTARDVFRRISAQYAKQELTEPAETTIEGQMIDVGPRLTVEALTLRLMDGFLIVFALCALGICLFFVFPGLPRDFSSIGSLALLLSRSPDLARICSGLGSVRLKHLGTWMHGYRFSTSFTRDTTSRIYQIKAELDPSVPEQDSPPLAQQELKWWRPAMFGRPLRVLTVLVPLILVACLEYGHRYSDRHTGYGIVPQGGYLKYAWTFAPAIVMVATASTFSVLDFSTRTFQPYHALSGARKASAKDLVETPFGYFAAFSLGRSLLRRQWALSATSLAICIAPFLTIVVSGLLQAENIGIGQGRAATIHQTFLPDNINNYDNNVDSSQGIVPMIVYENVSYPALTFNNLVFPNFTLETNASTPQTSRFEVNIPAAAMESECKVIEPKILSWTTRPPTQGLNSTEWTVDGRIDLSSYGSCSQVNRTSGQNTTTTTLPFNVQESLSSYVSKPAAESTFGSRVTANFANTTCNGQRVGYLYALMRLKASTIQDVVIINCKPRIDIVSANATGRSSDYQISDATILDDPSSPRRTFTTHYSQFNSAKLPCPGNPPFQTSLGCATQALLAYAGLNEAALFQPTNATALATAFTNLLNIIYAMRFTYWQRASTEQPPSRGVFFPATTRLQASILDQTEYRVVQSLISTRILQALLGTMSLCALIAWAGTRSKKVLTKNPQSIAAVASLLVDADMLRDIPPGAEFMDDKELKRNGVFEGGFYSIGWWGDDRGRRFGIDVGQAEKPT
ncbi:hypothetical protein BDZ85DRAFT_17567 [Elsinoe ampelina]|uniref:Uncharacterized protein n=1 Tax=Elsinoe ampelina TaxID=302913 RepID=A0A6A6G6T5_9PEZI|nr:hypothetical protein BDZ85DRAFT_17567 [Elsinoe ampelina]